MGVFIFGALFYLVSYFSLRTMIEPSALNRLFVFGIASIPVIAILTFPVLALVGLFRPLPVSPEAGVSPLYYRNLQVNGLLKVLFVAALYHSIAVSTSNPLLILIVGCVVFSLAIPQHLFRLWTRREAPDRYDLFILNQGTFPHRLLLVGLSLAFQYLWILTVGGPQ